MTFGSLFAGIGGFDLGFERAGMTCSWQVEINEFCRRVLAKHWPDVRRHDDVKTFPPTDAKEWRVDTICGGFPCQDISCAGRRVGIGGKRSGLWSEFARIIGALRPRYVVVENSADLVRRGLNRVLGDLAACGYDAEWSPLSGCAMGASHMRKRLLIVAYPKGGRAGQLRRITCQSESEARREVPWPQAEPGVHRELDGVPDRVDRLTAIGNSIVPQVAEWIGRRLMNMEAA
jgi:DNA (cytosine-5)-methyltransferase 1